MKLNKKLLCVLLSILFLTVPLGIVAFTPTGSITTLGDAAIPAADYDFENRREPVSVLVYTEYADLDPGEEFDHAMVELQTEYDYKFEYENLTDSTQLAGMIYDFDVLLLIEQELATYAQMDAVAAAWDGFLQGWVDDGGVLICMDHIASVGDSGIYPTARILNNTGLMRIYNPTSRSVTTITLSDPTDPLAFGATTYTGPSGQSSFDTPDGETVFETAGQTVVAHRYFGTGHVVMLGFDMFTFDTNQPVILANAVRLTRLAVFDDSHNLYWDPLVGYNTFATYIQENLGFAIATMTTWDETLVRSSQVYVAGVNTASVVPYTANELNIVTGFVASGGGLLILTDVWAFGNSTDPLLAEFGFARNQTAAFAGDTDDHEGQPNQPIFGSENIANHSATISVTSIQMMGPTAFTTIPAEATPLIWTDSDGTAEWSAGGDASGLAVAASLHHGAGRIVAISDGDFLTDYDNDADTIDFYDHTNEYFASSVMVWLSAAGIPEKTILFEESHTPYESANSLRDFAWLLSFNGFNLRWENQFSEQLIDEADVMIIVNGATNYTAPQIDVINQFVERGGGLFAMCDWSTYNEETNMVISAFGLTVNGTSFLYDTDDGWLDTPPSSYIAYEGNNIGNHPITVGVSRIEIDRGCGFSEIGSGTALVMTDNDGTAGWRNITHGFLGDVYSLPVIAVTEYHLGRVVVLPDINFFSPSDTDGDGTWTLYDSDNDVLTANIFYWLAENRAPIVEVLFPNGGELLNGTHMVEWTAVDPNRDEMTFDVFISDNNGSDWSSLASGISGLAFEWNTTHHDDGTSYMIRIEASDGMLTDLDDSDGPFELDNFAPGGLPIDPLLLAVIGVGVVLVVIVLVFLMKKKGGGKKKK